MTVTEQEASNKICPFSRNQPLAGLCMGSRCMAWNWVQSENESMYANNPDYIQAQGKLKANVPLEFVDGDMIAKGWTVNKHVSAIFSSRYTKPRKNRLGECGLTISVTEA